MVSERTARVLARCNGFRVTAGGETVGVVATPVFAGSELLPRYLLARIDGAVPGLFRAIPTELIATADATAETVTLVIGPSEVAALPEPNPLDPSSISGRPLPPPSPGPPPPKRLGRG